jgi:hypothetical protein
MSLALPALASRPLYEGSRFGDLWKEIQSDPYETLPEYSLTFGSLYSGFTNLIRLDASRTLSDERDLLPRFQKRVHPIGICFAGKWTIDAETPYTGYFKKGSEGLIIVRASEATGRPRVGGYRSFGIAGKIFPTSDVNDAAAYKTANFFTVDDLGGTDSDSFLDLVKTNEPDVSVHLDDLGLAPALAVVAKTFAGLDSNAGIRQLYPIAELGLAAGETSRAPRWMALRSENAERVLADDFRDELRLGNFAEGLRFSILVSDTEKGVWRRVGQITLDQEALTDSCDHRLHFHHPKWRD